MLAESVSEGVSPCYITPYMGIGMSRDPVMHVRREKSFRQDNKYKVLFSGSSLAQGMAQCHCPDVS